MRRTNKESGSAAFIAVAALGSLSLAFIFAQESAVKTKQAVDRSKAARFVEEKNTGAMSALGHYKGLISPKKQSTGGWIPALYATNYFDRQWSMMAPGTSGAKLVQKSSVETTINLREPALNDKDIGKVMSAAAPPKMENFTVKFLAPNFDSTEKLVETVDIEVTGREKGSTGETLKVLARVPLPPPVPYDAKLKYRKPGGTWVDMTQDADLTDGPYEFIASVSGIAFDGDLLIDGSSKSTRPLFGGRDQSTGRVTHEAVNYKNVGGTMGPAFLYDPAPEPDPEPVVVEAPAAGGGNDTGGGGGGASTDGTACGFTKGSYGGSGTGGGGGGAAPALPPPIPPTPSLPLTGTFQVVIRGPDGQVADTGQTEVFKVKIRKPPPPPVIVPGKGGGDAGPDTGGRDLTADDYRNRCTAECPYIGEKATGDDIGGHAAYTSAGPVSAMHTFVEGQQRWGIMTKKVCFKFPGGPRVGYDIHESEVWVYDPNTCKGEKLFTRGACGCLTGDTKILLGDGKSEKRIDELNKWDRVWNPILKKSFEVRKYTAGPETKPLVRIALEGRSIDATTDHPFLTTKGLRPATELSEGDRIRVGTDSWQKITGISRIPVPAVPPTVWNLELEGPDDDLDSHYIVANGIVTGDLLIQKKLKNQPQIGSNAGSKLD